MKDTNTTIAKHKIKKHDLCLLNNIRLEYNTDNNTIYLWIYHDKNYINGTFYKITDKGILSLCTIRENSYEEETIKW